MAVFWEWEDVERAIDSIRGQLGDHPLLHKKIIHYKISRNEDQDLNLTVTAPQQSYKPREPDRQLGEVYKNETKINISSDRGSVTLTGVSFEEMRTTRGITTSVYSVRELDLKFDNSESPEYTFDWIGNAPHEYMFMGGGHQDETTNLTTRIYSGDPEIILKSRGGSIGLANHSTRMRLAGYDIVFGVLPKSPLMAAIRPGFILYIGAPNKEKRREIRDSISFALGAPLVHVGCSTFATDYSPLGIEAVKPQSMGGRAWNIPSLPPTSIGEQVLDSKALELVASAFLENFRDYDLQDILWRTWYASIAPYYMAPAYYGALIETLQKKYTENPANKIDSRIVARNDYNKSKAVIARYLAKLQIDDQQRTLLLQKIEAGNVAPQKIIAQRFYQALDLKLGDLELDAWKRRNDAAHGNKITEGGEIELIRETKILHVMLNRIMLRLVQAAHTYIDYYTFDHPVTALREPIRQPN